MRRWPRPARARPGWGRFATGSSCAAGREDDPEAAAAADRFRAAFAAALNDDLNAPEALGALHVLVREGNRLLDEGRRLGPAFQAAWALADDVLAVAPSARARTVSADALAVAEEDGIPVRPPEVPPPDPGGRRGVGAPLGRGPRRREAGAELRRGGPHPGPAARGRLGDPGPAGRGDRGGSAGGRWRGCCGGRSPAGLNSPLTLPQLCGSGSVWAVTLRMGL